MGQAERFFIDYETFKSEVDERFAKVNEDLADFEEYIDDYAGLTRDFVELKERVDRLSVYGPQPRPMPAPRLVTVLIRYPNGSTTELALKDFKQEDSSFVPQQRDVNALIAAIGQINQGA